MRSSLSGVADVERTPHPALRATFSRKGRREAGAGVLPEKPKRPVEIAQRPALDQRLACIAAVAADGGDQLVEAIEHLLAPQMVDQRDLEMPAIDVGAEIEQVRLEGRQ